jgi:ABC-type multidrug transport system permease subunit
MPPVAIEVGIVLYEYIIILVACTAVVLAIHWKKNEFLAGLFFLLLYTILDAVTIVFSTILQKSVIDASQFGFILLALISFIIGMRPSVKVTPVSGVKPDS